jgi:hypothetical protein
VDAPSPALLITPAPSPAQAAAIVAAIECFVRDTAPPDPRSQHQATGGWLRAARAEAVRRVPGAPAAAADWRPWRDLVRTHPH